MRVFLSLLLILATNFAFAKQMEITCDSTVNEYKYNQIEEYGLNIGDIWVTNKYVFDASDFSNGEGEGTAQRTKDFKFKSQKTVSNVPYYVNRASIVFGTLRHPTSINRKTLEILEEQVTPYKCRIAEVDTSENAF